MPFSTAHSTNQPPCFIEAATLVPRHRHALSTRLLLRFHDPSSVEQGPHLPPPSKIHTCMIPHRHYHLLASPSSNYSIVYISLSYNNYPTTASLFADAKNPESIDVKSATTSFLSRVMVFVWVHALKTRLIGSHAHCGSRHWPRGFSQRLITNVLPL